MLPAKRASSVLDLAESLKRVNVKRHRNNNFEEVVESGHESCLSPICFYAVWRSHATASAERNGSEKYAVPATGSAPEPPSSSLCHKTLLGNCIVKTFKLHFEFAAGLTCPNQERCKVFCLHLASALKICIMPRWWLSVVPVVMKSRLAPAYSGHTHNTWNSSSKKASLR